MSAAATLLALTIAASSAADPAPVILPGTWVQIPESNYFMQLSSIRNFLPDQQGIRAIARITHRMPYAPLTYTVAFTCTGPEYTLWHDASAPWLRAEPGSVIDTVGAIACGAPLQ